MWSYESGALAAQPFRPISAEYHSNWRLKAYPEKTLQCQRFISETRMTEENYFSTNKKVERLFGPVLWTSTFVEHKNGKSILLPFKYWTPTLIPFVL